MKFRTFLQFGILALGVIVIAGCYGDPHEWNSKDISGLMPELAYQLIDTSGSEVTAADNTGSIRMLFFGFTHCPDICPTTLQKLSQAVGQLPEPLRDEVRIVFISVDPQRDTPERLKTYVEFFSDSIIGLTGTEENLRTLSKRYRTTFGYEEPDEKGNYDVSHSSAVYVFDREGKARLLVRPEQQSLEDIKQDLAVLTKSAG